MVFIRLLVETSIAFDKEMDADEKGCCQHIVQTLEQLVTGGQPRHRDGEHGAKAKSRQDDFRKTSPAQFSPLSVPGQFDRSTNSLPPGVRCA